MASYQDLYNLKTESALKNKIVVACLVAVKAIRDEDSGTTNHANRVEWAKRVLQNPETEGDIMFRAVIAANNAATIDQIKNASDADIQTAVNATINLVA